MTTHSGCGTRQAPMGVVCCMQPSRHRWVKELLGRLCIMQYGPGTFQTDNPRKNRTRGTFLVSLLLLSLAA
jgi:hypothetical protein